MNTTEILSSYIKKLGHPLKEIRERALKLLIAKLELGWQLDDELAGTRHLLESLLAWFHVEQPSNQQEALYLLLKIIKTQSGTYIVKEYGLKKLLLELNKLSDKLDPHAAELYDDVIDTLRFLNSVQSQESLSVPHLNIPSGTSSDCDDGSSADNDCLGANYQSSQASSESHDEININRCSISKTCDGIKILLFPWANMGTSDTKTILLIEDALNLLKSTRRCCRFIRDVFLRDFPAEIFLNRPSIIQYLLAILERGNGGKLSEPLHVLLCVTRALTSRLKQLYCLDLIHEADKLHITKGQESEDKVNTELEEIVSDVRQATGFRSKEDGLQALRQLPAPIFALDALQTILSAMARSVLLADGSGKNEGLDLNELNICISLVESFIGLLLDCVNASFWTMDHNTKTYRDIAHKSCMVMRMFGDLLTKYRSSYTSTLDRHQHRLAWLRLLPSAHRLLQWTARSALAPAALVTALQSARLDPALDMFYEGVAGDVGDCLMATETASNKEYKSKYRELKKLFSAMADAVTFMKDKDSIGLTKKVLTCIKNSLPVLELHLNESYLKDVGEILLKRLKDWDLNDKEWNEARSTTLSLMAHSNEFVQSRFYAMMAEVVKMVFVDEDGDHLENEKCLMLFCDVGILTEICCHGLNSESSEVSTSAEQIMLYLLRGRMLLSEKCWWRLLASLMPVFPLLHAYAAHDTVLGQAICKSLEPDIAECMGVSRAEALAGLARLLFVGCPPVQMDAALCLCCLLDEEKFLPPKESLRSDVLLSALRRVECADFNVDFSKTTPKSPQTSGLIQILDVLKQDITLDDEGHGLATHSIHVEPALEPSLRRATLQQLSVLMMKSELHETFESYDGIKIVVAILRLSLLVDDFLAFPECAISCVSILNSICYGSRHSLAKITDLPALLLRVILIFPANEATVQMASQVIAVLAWAGFTLQELDKDRNRVLALPRSVVQRTNLPFPAQEYWRTSPNTVHSSIEWLQSEEDYRSAIRVHWSYAWNGSRILRDAPPPPGPLSLRPTTHDVATLQSACPVYASSRALLMLQNATSHLQVNEALALISGYTHLVSGSSVEASEFAALPWKVTLSRFLTAPPASPRDIVLLTTLLKFVLDYMDHVPSDGGTKEWIKTSFIDSSASMVTLLSREQLYPQQTLQDNIEVTQLHIHIVKVLLRCVILMEWEKDGDIGKRESLLKILLACLERIDLKNFHMLGYLNELMLCIRYITNSTLTILSEDTSIDCLRLMARTLAVCGGGAGRKGQGCRLDGVITLLALLRGFQERQVPVQRWGSSFDGATVVSIVSSATCARAELRAGALSVLAALAHHAAILPHLTDAIPAPSISGFAAATFAEKREANAVRARAATLLTALCARSSTHSDVHDNEILQRMHEYYFMENCLEILVEFCENKAEYVNYLEPNVPISLMERRTELEVRATKSDGLQVTPSVPKFGKAPPTPGLVVALSDVIYNVAAFANCPVLAWNEQGLFRLLFKCTSWSSSARSDNAAVRAATCRALARVADAHPAVRAALASTRDCLHALMDTLAPADDEDLTKEHISALAQALLLLSTLLRERAACDSVWRQLREDQSGIFFHLLLQTLEVDEPELQEAGLYCIASLSQSISKTKHKEDTTDDSWIQLIDNLKSPYFEIDTPRVKEDFCSGDGPDSNCQPEYLVEELCKNLMYLYQKHSVDKRNFQASPEGNWTQVCSSLSSLLSVSGRARHYAVHREFNKTLLLTLQGVRDHLSMHGKTADVIRNADSNPVLLTLYWLLTTIASLMTECMRAKESFAADGIAVSLLRLWPWCMMTSQLRTVVVQLLLSFTNGCPAAWSAMSSCVGGRSLIGEVCALASRAPPAPRAPPPPPPALQVLTHCLENHHCRALVLKSDVLSCIHKLRSSERSRHGKASLAAWVSLAEGLARYSDGAASLLELRKVLVTPMLRGQVMTAIAHAAHHQRSVFLQSPELLELLSGSLIAGAAGEVAAAARAVWALAANNHRAKLALRSAGVSSAAHTALERLHRGGGGDHALQLLTYVNTVLTST